MPRASSGSGGELADGNPSPGAIPSTVVVSTTNTPPVASAGPNQNVTQIGATIQLDGSQSYDLDGDPLTYHWSLVSIPTGSKTVLSNPNIVNPT